MYKIKSDASRFIIEAILTVLALLYLIPFIWLISCSLKRPTELFAEPTVWIPAIPQFKNYIQVFIKFPFILYLTNTATIIGFVLVGTVISNTLVAYGFSKIDWKHRDKVLIFIIATMMLPFQAVMIPQFEIFKSFGWLGSLYPLIIPECLGKPFFIFLLRQFFMGIPKELSEAAKMDGATEFYIYSRIILPLSKPAIITVIIYAFCWTWGDFIKPLIFLNNDKLYTLSLGIQQIISDKDPQWTLLLTIGVCMTSPVIVFFLLMKKYFVVGMTITGIKG